MSLQNLQALTHLRVGSELRLATGQAALQRCNAGSHLMLVRLPCAQRVVQHQDVRLVVEVWQVLCRVAQQVCKEVALRVPETLTALQRALHHATCAPASGRQAASFTVSSQV